MPPVIVGYHDRPEWPVPGKLRVCYPPEKEDEKEFFPEVPGGFLLMMERLKQGGQEGRKAGNLGDFRDAVFGIGHSRRMN